MRMTAARCLQSKGEAWVDGAIEARGLHPAQVELGLHLDFTEHPLNPALRMPLRKLIASAYANRLDVNAVRDEIRAQLDAFESALGRAPAYVDGHQHVHQLPVIRELLMQELASRYELRRMWLRATQSPQRAAHADLPTYLKSGVIASLGSRELSKLAADAGLRQNRHLLGVYNFEGDVDGYWARLERWLDNAQTGDLLMCHAGLSAQLVEGIAAARQHEYAVLASPYFDDIVSAVDIRLQPMGRILKVSEH